MDETRFFYFEGLYAYVKSRRMCMYVCKESEENILCIVGCTDFGCKNHGRQQIHAITIPLYSTSERGEAFTLHDGRSSLLHILSHTIRKYLRSMHI